MPRAIAHAPEELTRDRLKRLGEGIGKVVYASEHWVVRRERSPREVVALIILWKVLRKRAHKLTRHETWDGFFAPRCGQLAHGEGANLIGSGGQRRAHGGRNRLPCRGHLIGRDAQLHRVFEAVKLGRIA